MRQIVCTLLLLALSAFCGQNVFSQDCLPDGSTPLPTPAFRKMMLDQFNYTIAGTNTPATGFKVDIAKPSITVTGLIYSSKQRSFLLNLQVSGGLNEGIAQVFSKEKLSGSFSATLGFNRVLNWRKAKFVADNTVECNILNQQVLMQRTMSDDLYRRLDTMYILEYLLEGTTPDFYCFRPRLQINGGNFSIYEDWEDEVHARSTNVTSNSYSNLMIEGILRKFGARPRAGDSAVLVFARQVFGVVTSIFPQLERSDEEYIAELRAWAVFRDMVNKIGNPSTSTYSELRKMHTEYAKHKDLEEKADDSFSDQLIDQMKDIWVIKRIYWLNVSPSITNSGSTLLDTLKTKLIDTASLTYGVSASLNVFSKYKQPGRFFYGRIGAGLMRVDNVVDLKKIDYQREVPVSGSTTISEVKTGSAFRGDLYYGSGYRVFGEVFHTPFKSSIMPGYYAALEYKKGDAWLNQEKLGVNLGLFWSVINNEKDSKNLLSIIPYVSWSNVFTEYTDVAKTHERKASDLFSVNIRFGIPVNIGK